MTKRTGARSFLILLVMALLLAACGSDSATSPEPPDTTHPPRGWVDGEPDWDSAGGAEGYSSDVVAMPTTDADRFGASEPEPRGTGPLQAGSVDDNERFEDYLAYLDRLRDNGIQLRDLAPTGRIVISVVGSNDLPVAGAEVVVTQGGTEVTRSHTVADGTTRFLPALHGASTDEPVEVSVGDVSATTEPDSAVTLEVDVPGGVDGPVALDVLFLLDATGSMGDEIDQLKTSIDSVSERIDALETQPDVRFGMTLYRDEGDAFVTSTYDFTGDLADFRSALADVTAGGGGDYPEALDEGLAEALTVPAWRDPTSTVQMVFLVADAPPHVERDVAQAYPDSARDAVNRGIKIFPVASSSSDDQAEGVFRQLAQSTGARFVFLSYGAGGAATGESTDIDSTDYEELALDDLVVRLVAEELDHLTGDTTPVPTSTTTTTAPPGQ